VLFEKSISGASLWYENEWLGNMGSLSHLPGKTVPHLFSMHGSYIFIGKVLLTTVISMVIYIVIFIMPIF
jgi:hypothetical protein